MALFGRNKGSKNWQKIQGESFQDQAKNRDVHASQNLERGKQQEVTRPIRAHVLSVIGAALFAALGFVAGILVMFVMGLYNYILTIDGGALQGFDPSSSVSMADWRLWAWTAFVFLCAWLILNQKFMMSHRSSNSMADSTDINTYENDQRVMIPEEAWDTYDFFPDTGAHSSVQVSSMLSHTMMSKKGLKPVDVVERYPKDVYDADGNIASFKGEVMYNEDGLPIKTRLPIIDEEFGQELFTASGIPPAEKEIRKPVVFKGINYNPKDDTGNRRDRDKQEYDTVAELVNNDWTFPEYEVQRPSGAYIVDTAPVNTMVLAITRAGKGQTVIEPTIDMWTREKRQNNFVVNDPKGLRNVL